MRHWPLFDLGLYTPRLQLRLPSLERLDELAELAAEGVHDPEVMPFNTPWIDAEPAERARGTVQHHWHTWATWTPEEWAAGFVVIRDGRVVGTQELAATDFSVVGEVRTGSWLGRRFHGQGIGTEMRAAVLHLAFAGLGARSAISTAFTDNPASLAISRRLGYEPDGIERSSRRGEAATSQRLRLTRQRWEHHRQLPVRVEGLQPCLTLFGLTYR